MSAFLEVEGLEVSYGQSQALFGIDFAVDEGEVLGVMGRNGMGKTTTLRSIMGLTRPQGGQVKVAGVEVQHLPAFRIARAGLAIVPEGRQVLRHLTVGEHLLMAQSPRATGADRSHDNGSNIVAMTRDPRRNGANQLSEPVYVACVECQSILWKSCGISHVPAAAGAFPP